MSQREEEEQRSVNQSRNEQQQSPTTTDRNRLFSSMFFGRDSRTEDDKYSGSTPLDGKERSGAQALQRVIADKDEELAPSNQIDGILSQIDKQIPHDPIALRQTTLYNGALQMLQWQRDNYMVGTEYADWRKSDRSRQQNEPEYFKNPDVASYEIPYDNEALGHHQFARIAGDFIPTNTVKSVLTPVVTGLLVPEGALYGPIKNATVGVILGQQSNLEETIRNQTLQFLDNPQSREAMKNSTQGMLIQTTKTDSERNESKSTEALESGIRPS
jgi:hypothetical protein